MSLMADSLSPCSAQGPIVRHPVPMLLRCPVARFAAEDRATLFTRVAHLPPASANHTPVPVGTNYPIWQPGIAAPGGGTDGAGFISQPGAVHFGHDIAPSMPSLRWLLLQAKEGFTNLTGVDFIENAVTLARKLAAKEAVVVLFEITNVEMALPRITGRQMQRSNVPSATPEEYYRRNVYLPLLADFENQLRDRFDAHKKVVVGLNMLLPKFCASASLSDIDDAVQFYLGDIPSANVIEAEFTLWVNKCCQIEEKNRPACALQALEMCNRDFFPNIHSLLSILATLPVSTSTPERTFSTLRRLKSYLRNHVNNDRLTGLALLSIHRELQVTPEQVLTEFCKLPRRKNFLV
ncbi:hypothetical protein HPB51_027824 [Rhipicephalus microplus]|uniref:HAT C-terminal dimerisation domain-containing protein n=1 Tax=Rhipicephalus microplus TaxID=6941 RepID=A0A9J6CZ75_RHIMP|nr:hypothetical protein HPB51_027824 [Rhipicephalus microplus]